MQFREQARQVWNRSGRRGLNLRCYIGMDRVFMTPFKACMCIPVQAYICMHMQRQEPMYYHVIVKMSVILQTEQRMLVG